MVAYWDSDLRNVVANQAHSAFFGKSPEEIYGCHIFELLVGELGEVSRPYVEAAMSGLDQTFDKTLTDRHGITRHVQASYMPDVVGGQVQGLYVQVSDVTTRVEAERARDEAQRLLNISRENAPFGEALFTTAGRALYLNPSLRRMLGYHRKDPEGLSYLDGVHLDERDAAAREWRELVKGSVTQTFTDARYIRNDGSEVWLQRHLVLVPGAHGSADIVLSQFQDITERKLAEAELARLAATDPLTGLHNRHALLTHVAEHGAVNPSALVGIVFADLDGFKYVNDVYGHAAGDAVLQGAARRLLNDMAPPNRAYRLGGDEFVVLIVDKVTESAVAQLAERIASILSGSHRLGEEGVKVTLTASVGWTCGGPKDIGELIREADLDMYRRKAQRRAAPQDPGLSGESAGAPAPEAGPAEASDRKE